VVTNLEGYGYMVGVLDLEGLRHFHSKRAYTIISILKGQERSIAYDGSQAPGDRFPQTSRLCSQNIPDWVDFVLDRQGGKYQVATSTNKCKLA
jgi:hypothetical protein